MNLILLRKSGALIGMNGLFRCRPRVNRRNVRELFSKTGQWEPKFSNETRQELEVHWINKMNTRDTKDGQV